MFAGDCGDELQFVRVFGQIVALAKLSYKRLIRQFSGFANAVDEDDAFEFLPDLKVLQDGQKRGNAGTCG
ncbi:hypothetical protein D3C85_1117470 [compost metagenome]